jgi:uncharacterized repeat protein (TIGR03803 family)
MGTFIVDPVNEAELALRQFPNRGARGIMVRFAVVLEIALLAPGFMFNLGDFLGGTMEVKKVSPPATTALIVVAFFLTTLTNASAGTEKVLANFPGAHGGLQPWAGLVSDAAGNFYGVTYYRGRNGKGEVFRVRYSAATGWSECTAYGFKGGKDGAAPYGGLIFDAAGNVYGTTSSGGFYGGGTAFTLTHTSGCNWTGTVLDQFGKGEDGNYPAAALVFDQSGNLYGTTQAGGTHGYGTVFKLQLTSGKWTEHVPHNFIGTDGSSPWASVTFDRAGNLYGTTATGGKYNYGVVFQLSPASGGKWIEHVIHTFTGGADGSEPQAGVVFDSAGNLYSASVYGGTLSAGNITYSNLPSSQTKAGRKRFCTTLPVAQTERPPGTRPFWAPPATSTAPPMKAASPLVPFSSSRAQPADGRRPYSTPSTAGALAAVPLAA